MNQQRDRLKSYMETEFLPVGSQDVKAEMRIANALEYAAYHLGQIDKKLDTLIEEIRNSRN